MLKGRGRATGPETPMFTAGSPLCYGVISLVSQNLLLTLSLFIKLPGPGKLGLGPPHGDLVLAARSPGPQSSHSVQSSSKRTWRLGRCGAGAGWGWRGAGAGQGDAQRLLRGWGLLYSQPPRGHPPLPAPRGLFIPRESAVAGRPRPRAGKPTGDHPGEPPQPRVPPPPGDPGRPEGECGGQCGGPAALGGPSLTIFPLFVFLNLGGPNSCRIP